MGIAGYRVKTRRIWIKWIAKYRHDLQGGEASVAQWKTGLWKWIGARGTTSEKQLDQKQLIRNVVG